VTANLDQLVPTVKLDRLVGGLILKHFLIKQAIFLKPILPNYNGLQQMELRTRLLILHTPHMKRVL
jgi:hypothetical protein